MSVHFHSKHLMPWKCRSLQAVGLVGAVIGAVGASGPVVGEVLEGVPPREVPEEVFVPQQALLEALLVHTPCCFLFVSTVIRW